MKLNVCGDDVGDAPTAQKPGHRSCKSNSCVVTQWVSSAYVPEMIECYPYCRNTSKSSDSEFWCLSPRHPSVTSGEEIAKPVRKKVRCEETADHVLSATIAPTCPDYIIPQLLSNPVRLQPSYGGKYVPLHNAHSFTPLRAVGRNPVT